MDIKKLREKLGLSQLAFGKKLNLGQGVISLFEKGTRKPNAEILEKLKNLMEGKVMKPAKKSSSKNKKVIKEKKALKATKSSKKDLAGTVTIALSDALLAALESKTTEGKLLAYMIECAINVAEMIKL